MKNNKPPASTGGRKMPPAFVALLGLPRTCDSCGAEKLISWETFAPSRKSDDGVSVTCRSCQGRGAAQRKKETPRDETPGLTGWPDPETRPKEYWQKVEAATDRLYEIADDRTKASEFRALCRSLNAITKILGDPSGEGRQQNRELAFRTFVAVVSRVIAKWYEFGPIHDDLIAGLTSDADRVLLLASRGCGKSGLTDLYCAFLLHNFNLIKILVVSGGAKRAGQALKNVRNFISRCPLLRCLEPQEDDPDNGTQFVVGPASGRLGAFHSFSSFGITSNMVGQRCDVAVLDDVETRSDTTPEAQERLDYLTGEIENLMTPQTPEEPWAGRIVALGTPQVFGRSIYGRWIAAADEAGKFIWHSVKACVFTEDLLDGDKRTTLHSRWPAKFSDAELMQRRARMSKADWSLHWAISLSSLQEDPRPIKLRDFLTVAWDPNTTTFPKIVRPGGAKLAHLSTFQADDDDAFFGPSFVSPETALYVATIAALDPASGLGRVVN